MNTIKVTGTGTVDQRVRALEQAVNYGEVVLPFNLGDGGGGAGEPGPPGPAGPTGPAGPGVPAGGTAGQVLEKQTGTDYDTVWADPPVTQATSGTWNWRVADGTTDPGVRNLSPDVSAAPTMLRFSTTTVSGSDAHNLLVTTAPGDVLLMQTRTDASKWAKVQVRAPVIDHGTWFEVPVTGISQGAGGAPENNQDVIVSFQRGGTAAALAYRHVQATAATTWAITHNLSFRPNVTAVDSTGRAIWPGALDYLSDTTVQLTFSAAVGGEAYLT
ncbi:MAG TPA: hypothetical protein VKB50_26290 [Vicinamibacterales bacterium]|nr:hypothetical protein [Vicinamibacterales bacterium]